MFDNFDWNSLKENVQDDSNKFGPDERYWKITKDKNKCGTAQIRFLPSITADGKLQPWVKIYEYSLKKSVQGAKPRWYINTSPETIQKPCPVKEHYTKLKHEGTAESEKESENFKRRTQFVSNIYVVNDPGNPDNNGKVFLFKFGPKLKGKFESWLEPDANQLAMGVKKKELWNPLANGCNVLLSIKPQGNFASYDDTIAQDPSALFENKETAINYIKENCYDLQTSVLGESEFKSYDTLVQEFNKFLGVQNVNQQITQPTVDVQPVTNIQPQQNISENPTSNPQLQGEPTPVVQPQPQVQPTTTQQTEDEDDWLNEIN